MPTAISELDVLIAFNDQLLALEEAGVPIGFAGKSNKLAGELERINSLLARRASRGEPIDQILELEPDVPSWYRTLAVSAIKSGNVDTTLRDFTRVANSADQSDYVTESALFYPLIVVALAYCGIIAFCFFFVPSLQAAYSSFRIPAGSGLRILELLRNTLPFWVAIPPVILLLLVVGRIQKRPQASFSNGGSSGFFARLSGAAGAMANERSAYLAESIASLEENGVPPDEAIALASGAARPAIISGHAHRKLATPASVDFSRAVPPFLHWALFHSEPAVARQRALAMAAALYRKAADNAMRRARIIAPMILLVAIGGTVTLLYGLALFVPVVQMLKAVALAPIRNG